jgi:hypothetical protein
MVDKRLESLHNEEIHNLFYSPNNVWMIKFAKDEMSRILFEFFVGKPERKIKDVSMDGRINKVTDYSNTRSEDNGRFSFLNYLIVFVSCVSSLLTKSRTHIPGNVLVEEDKLFATIGLQKSSVIIHCDNERIYMELSVLFQFKNSMQNGGGSRCTIAYIIQIAPTVRN